jgi:hypothetical protein
MRTKLGQDILRVPARRVDGDTKTAGYISRSQAALEKLRNLHLTLR